MAPENFLSCRASGDGGNRFEGALRLLLRDVGDKAPEGPGVFELFESCSGWFPVDEEASFGGRAWLKASCSSARVDSSSSTLLVRVSGPSAARLASPCS